MKREFLGFCTSVVALTVLCGCIPVRNDVSLSGSVFQDMASPLAMDEGIVILGWNGASEVAVRGRAGARYDDSMAACVRGAIAETSPATRIVPLNQFRPAAGGIFATPNAMLTEEAIGGALRDATVSPALTALKIRYLFMVDGATENTDFHSSGGPYAAQSSNRKRTHIQVTAWDAMKGARLDSFGTQASGFENFTSVGLIINVLEYAPTESTACKDVAGKILHYVSVASSAAK